MMAVGFFLVLTLIWFLGQDPSLPVFVAVFSACAASHFAEVNPGFRTMLLI